MPVIDGLVIAYLINPIVRAFEYASKFMAKSIFPLLIHKQKMEYINI